MIKQPRPIGIKGSPMLGNPNSTFKLSNLNTHKEIFIQNGFILILDVWRFNNPALVELRGPPCLGTPIPPLSPRILNTLNQVFIQNEFILILDVR
jgi:hypothetical protein